MYFLGTILNEVFSVSIFIHFCMLQTQDHRVDQEEELCIRVNTRELNRELCTRLSTLYTST